MEEIWKEIVGYEGKYWVSNLGRIKSNYRGITILSLYTNKCGYYVVNFYKNGKRKNFLVHRLVALNFIPNPRMVNEVNHIDGIKTNNCVANLEWCTQKENVWHAEKMGLRHHPIGENSGKATSFFQFDLNGKLIKHWGSIMDCAHYLFENDEKGKKYANVRALATNISKNLNLKHYSACGYIFYLKPEINIVEYRKLNKKYNRRIAVIAIDTKTNEILEFPSIRFLNGKIMPNGFKAEATYVCKVCKGKRKSHAGYYWRYKS